MFRSGRCLALALGLAGCLSGAGSCDELNGLGNRRVPSGSWSRCPGATSDVPLADFTPGAMRVDRDAGVVTFTRTRDGAVVVSRYRIITR